jgi:RNA polymerase sigma-70 factor (ECF subfamily)
MPLTEIDRRLIARCLDREPGSWNDFVDRFMGLFIHIINHTLHAHGIRSSQDEFDELCSEIFVSVLADEMKVLRNFRGKSSLASYLLVIARRIVLRSITTRRRTEVPSRPLPSLESSLRDGEDSEIRRIEDSEELDFLMRNLPQGDAAIIRMFHLDGLSYREIESRTNIPLQTIGSILSRAREQMRKDNLQV